MKITLVSCDDWVAIYIDGKLKTQNHRLSPDEVLSAIGVEFDHEEACEYACRVGQLPKDLSEVEFD